MPRGQVQPAKPVLPLPVSRKKNGLVIAQVGLAERGSAIQGGCQSNFSIALSSKILAILNGSTIHGKSDSIHTTFICSGFIRDPSRGVASRRESRDSVVGQQPLELAEREQVGFACAAHATRCVVSAKFAQG